MAITETHVVSGVITTSVSGNVVGISGQSINVGSLPTISISGNVVNISGQQVQTSVSGNSVSVSNFPTTNISGQSVQTSVSGNVVQTSISGNIFYVTKIGPTNIILGAPGPNPTASNGSTQLTGASGGTALPTQQQNQTLYFTSLVPYSGASTPGNIWVGGSPFYDPNNVPPAEGAENPISVVFSNGTGTARAVTDQSGYTLTWLM